eukprot:14603293-Alexandrium_andersonii.AAC.1
MQRSETLVSRRFVNQCYAHFLADSPFNQRPNKWARTEKRWFHLARARQSVTAAEVIPGTAC